MQIDDMLSRPRQKTLFSGISIVLLLGVLVLINILAQQLFVRVDLTKDKQYSLSQTSKKLVQDLNDRVIVKVYYSNNLPSEYSEVRQYLLDLLNEYKVRSNGKFSLEVYDARMDNDAGKEAEEYGLSLQQLQVWENDSLTYKASYIGLVLLYGDQQEVLDNLSVSSGLEYQITTALKKLVSIDMPVVAFLQDDAGETITSVSSDYSSIYTYLQGLYSVQTVSVDEAIPADVDILVVAGISQQLSDYTLYQIDQFVMRGGKVAFLVDYLSFITSGQQTIPMESTTGLDTLLTSYGVSIGQGVLLDTDAASVNVPVATSMPGVYMTQSQKYPAYPYIRDFGESVGGAGMTEMIVPFGTSVSFNGLEGVTSTVVARASKTSWLETDVYSISATSQATGEAGTHDFALMLEGVFPSAYKDTQAPVAPASTTTDATVASEPAAEKLTASGSTRMVVIGCSRIIEDDTLRYGGGLLFSNLVDWLALNDDLISVRIKGSSIARIKEMSEGHKNFIKAVTIVAMPLVVVVLGVVNWQLSKRRMHRVYKKIS
jgi:gliding-associated putative ABC transporter substrate-binding component GldG